MKTVKSLDELKRLALARGASTTVGKDKFNSMMAKADYKKPQIAPAIAPIMPTPELIVPTPDAPIEFKPEIVVQDVMPAMQASIDAIGAYATKADDLNQSNSKVMAEVQKVLAAVSAKPVSQPVKGWVMTVERDTRGLLTQIIATPKT